MSIDALQGVKAAENKAVSVTKAIRNAARDAGLEFDLMLGVAKRESSLRPDAEAKTSSASGLFQFIDQTWLGAVKEHGEALGLGDYAADITRGEKGFVVEDPERRDEILNLRFKPSVAAGVAGRTLAAAKDRLTQALGREASGSEVYMAHFLGERGAVRMLNAGEEAVAAGVDPRAAHANQPLFYEGGRALTVSEFRNKIALKLGVEETPMAQAAASAQPLEPARVPYRPHRVHAAPTATIETYVKPAPQQLRDVQAGLPNNLYAAIIDMQTDFIASDSDPADQDRFHRDDEQTAS
ncbi:MAG: lytic transglycosylase domain-containing protein [Pseudomonadota bacterium]